MVNLALATFEIGVSDERLLQLYREALSIYPGCCAAALRVQSPLRSHRLGMAGSRPGLTRAGTADAQR